MKKRIQIIIFCLSILIIGCTSVDKDFPGLEKLKKGMTREEVLNILDCSSTVSFDSKTSLRNPHEATIHMTTEYYFPDEKSFGKDLYYFLSDNSNAYILRFNINGQSGLQSWCKPIKSRSKTEPEASSNSDSTSYSAKAIADHPHSTVTFDKVHASPEQPPLVYDAIRERFKQLPPEMYDSENPMRAEPPDYWRAASPDSGTWINVFIVRDSKKIPLGYGIELFPKERNTCLVTETLIPIEPGVCFTWHDASTLVVTMQGREFMRITNSLKGRPYNGWNAYTHVKVE